MILKTGPNTAPNKVAIYGTSIHNVTKMKILGLTFSQIYNWNYYFFQIKIPLTSRGNIIRYLFN